MARIYYSRQYYNQLKRKQHDEYLKGQNSYFLYIKKYYGEYLKRKNEYYLYEKKYYEEYFKMQNSYSLYKKNYYKEYLKRQNGYYLYKKNYYEEYLKMQNKYYLYEKKIYEEYLKMQNGYYSYKKKYHEEYLKRLNKYYLHEKKHYEAYFKRQNDGFVNKRKYDKTYPSQSEVSNSFKTDSKEANNINDDIIRKDSNSSLEIKIEENNLEDKKHDSDKYDNLENKNSTSIEDSYNEEFIIEKYVVKEFLEEELKMQNDGFVNKRKYDKTYPSQNEVSNSFKTNSKEANNINDDIIRKNSNSSLEIKIEENNLEDKKHDSDKYDNLENKNSTSIEDSYNEEFIIEKYVVKEFLEEELKMQNDGFVNKRKYDKTYPSQSEVSNSFKTGSVEDNNINDDSKINNRNGSLEIKVEANNLIDKKHDSDKYDKTYPLQNEVSNSFKTGSIEDNNINDDSKINNRNGSLEINIEENNLEYQKHDSDKYDNLEDKNCISIEDSYNEDFLGEEDEDQIDKCNNEICKTVASHTSNVTARLITVKIPVVLTECSITITVQSSLKLEDDVLEIKHIRKNAYLNQCELIPNSKNDTHNTGMLFIAGFITSNIEYSTKDHNYKEGLSGKLKHATVDVPFKCTTRVTFNTLPKFKATTYQEEVEILQTSIRECNHYEVEITGRDIREQNFRLIEFFNEKVFCELISAEFVESDILENPTNKKCKSPLEQTFHDITENVVLFLTIQLLQNQDVIISK